MKLRAASPFCLSLLLAATCFLISSAPLFGQTTAARPDRGTMPNGSYAVSDFENVSLTNGNVNLSIPLASLPAIAGGKLSWAISANYNSKLWNITRTEADAPDNQYHPYVIDTPQVSDSAGWHISGQYIISLRNAHADFDYQTEMPPGSMPDPEYSLRINYNWYKLVITMPDGSEHELRPIDYTPYVAGDSFLHGYYKENPYQNGTMRYYSFDGSFLYAIVTSEANWTVYTPDGTKVIQTPDGIQRIQDTNGNKIKIFSDSNGTHYQDEQTGREIRYSYNPSGNGGKGQGTITYQTVGGIDQSIIINFDFTYVQGQIYKVNDWTPYALTGCTHFNQLSRQIQVIHDIVLPVTEPGVTRKFTFTYNSDATETASTNIVRFACSDPTQTYTRTASKGWGELSRIETPSGALIDYSYSKDAVHSFTIPDELAEASITQKKITHDGTNETWTYSVNATSDTLTNPDGSTVTEDKYSHSPGFAYDIGKAGLAYRTTQPFSRTERHWTHLEFSGANTDSAGGPVDFNPVVDYEYTTLLDASNNPLKMSAKAFQYDYNGNLLQTTDYDWFDPALVSRDAQGVPTGVPASATVLRVSASSYYNAATSSTSGNVYAKRSISTGTPLILNAPQQTSVGASITQFSYDGQSYGVAPTIGNVTTISRLDNRGDSNPANDVWVSVSHTYDTYGNLATTTDARGKVTQFFYDDATHVMPTRVVVDPQNGTGTQTTYTEYDYSTGAVKVITDPNNNISTMNYTNQLTLAVDPFGRPGEVEGPLVTVNGTPQHGCVKSVYQDSARKMIVSSDLLAQHDGLLKSETLYDQLGRASESHQYETATAYVTVKRTYDAMGRVSQVSNPYRAGGAVSWTTTSYDSLGRVLTVTTPDGAVISTSYAGNQVTVTDQAGKSRRSLTDALGRLTQVIEDPNGVAYQTNYTYDVLGNLSTVTQGTQHRYFMYDSLSHLIRAKNPEQDANASLALSDPVSGNSQWSMAYAYDNNGNLSSRTDARTLTGVTASYVYDSLNRNTTVNYADGSHVDRTYDTATNGRGRLSATSYYPASGANSQTAIEAYDTMGRPLSQKQYFYANGSWGTAYTTQRTYDLTGHVLTETYPSGKTVSYTYDQTGRTQSFAGNLGDGVARTYSSSITYNEWNNLNREQYGTDTPLYHKSFYNIRGQLFDTRLSSVNDTWDWNRGRLIFYYSSNHLWGQSGTDNNGNVLSVENWIPPANATLDQAESLTEDDYTYDALNRISAVNESRMTAAGGWVWAQQFAQAYSYDRYGNRTINAAQTWGTSINSQQFTVDVNKNQLGVPNGASGVMQYDSNGNLVNDTYSGAGARTYDAENRMVSATNNASQQSVYTYDGDGRRVRRQSYNQETWQVYGMDGELLAEYVANAGPSTPQKEYGYRNGELLVTATPAQSRTNVALSSAGAVATASSTYNSSYPVSAVNNGEHKGLNWGAGGGWNDASYYAYPDWVEIAFNGNKTIDEIDVYTLQDSYWSPIEPTESTTFSAYGLTGYEVQYWTGSSWVDVTGGNITGNNKVWKKLTFTPLSTSKIRVLVNAGADGYSRITEVEAYQAAISSDVEWMVADHLGTPRMIADKSGTLAGIKRHDYLPFGEELQAGSGGRGAAQGYVLDDLRQKFASYQRDIETNLDYAQARYYANTQGRFTSADPFNIIMERQRASKDEKAEASFKEYIGNPQHWNSYVYALNAPTVFNDPTGLDILIIENHATHGNPAGHTAIAITGRGVYSFGNAERGQRGATESHDIINGGVKDYILRELPKRDTTLIIIKTTPEQDNAAAAMLDATAASGVELTPGNIISDNCSIRVNKALDAAGIESVQNLSSTLPGSAGLRAIKDGGLGGVAEVIDIPQNSNLVQSDLNQIKQFEPSTPLPKPGEPGGTPVRTMPMTHQRRRHNEE